jgi:hypothetical protein
MILEDIIDVTVRHQRSLISSHGAGGAKEEYRPHEINKEFSNAGRYSRHDAESAIHNSPCHAPQAVCQGHGSNQELHSLTSWQLPNLTTVHTLALKTRKNMVSVIDLISMWRQTGSSFRLLPLYVQLVVVGRTCHAPGDRGASALTIKQCRCSLAWRETIPEGRSVCLWCVAPSSPTIAFNIQSDCRCPQQMCSCTVALLSTSELDRLSRLSSLAINHPNCA